MDESAQSGHHCSESANAHSEEEHAADEATLIERAAGGDKAAFESLARRRWHRVRRVAARICGPDEADDIAQVVFLRLWRHLPRLRGRLLAASARAAGGAAVGLDRWLVRVAANKAIDCSRHIGRHLRLIERQKSEPETATPSAALAGGEVARVFSQIASVLGERQRAAFVLREMEGLPGGEVAEILGVTASTVRNLVSQARRTLRSELRKRFPEYAPPASDQANG